MRVLPARSGQSANARQRVAPQKQMSVKTFPAPIAGWVLNENLSQANPLGARVLDNWFPTTTGIRVRGGRAKYATLSESGAVESMFVYKAGTTEKFFAATDDSVFEITTVADKTVIPSAAISSQTSGYYSAQQFGTAGGDYLYICNGDDDPQLFNGSTWTAIDGASTPAITGVTTADLTQVWSYASRLFFIEKETMNAWYLPTDAIGGAANSFSLAGIMKLGGYLVFGARWSVDAGDGLDDKCVFVSSEGEVAVYTGTNPGSASDWLLEGLYQIGKPLGKNCTMRAGGDLLIATDLGLVPISAALNTDIAALSMNAVSRQIQPEWEKAVNARRSLPWEVMKWPSNNMMVVSQPQLTNSLDDQCFVANLQTGAWSRFFNWDTRCLALFDSRGYFGANDGCVYQMESGGTDDGDAYTCTVVWQFDHLSAPAATKTANQARATFLSADPFTPRLSASVNYSVSLPAAPSAASTYTKAQWDVGLWDIAQWDGNTITTAITRWISIGQTGFVHAPQIQVTFGNAPTPDVSLVSFDMTYTSGGIVV